MLKPFIVPVLALELLLASIFPSSVFGFSTNDVSPYTSRLWQTDEGLPQDEVQSLCQSSDGYLAADLHDEVGSTVGSISVLSEMLRDFGEVGEEERKDITKINQLSMQTASSIREIVWFINPEYETLHELSLRMKDVADNLLSGMTYRMETPRENLSRKLPLEFRQNFFLIFKETLANVMKHSKASCVEIHVSENRGEWQLMVKDNGVGFDSNLASKGNGLKNLRRRTEKLNGTLEIKSESGQGTKVRLSVRLTT